VESLVKSELPVRLSQWEGLAPNRTLEMPVCIACLHHHVHMPDPILPSYVSARDEGKISFLTDAPEMLDTLMELGFGVILHGHAHSARRYAYGQHPRRAGGAPERQLSLAAIAGAGSVCLAKESEHIHHDHQFQVVECHENFVLIRSYEAPLRNRDKPRNWSAIEFELPYTRDHDDKFAEAMQGRLSQDLAKRATYELDRFNACVDFEGLIRGDSRLHTAIFAKLVKVLPGMPPEDARLAAARDLEIKSRYERRLEECRVNPAKAKEERRRLHQWLDVSPTGRLDTYLALTWEWPPIHATIR
jgi:hypothetical protein